MTAPVALAALVTALVTLVGLSRRLLNRTRRVAEAVISDPGESTVVDERGAVRSIQAADVIMDPRQLDRLWSPVNLERLARTYWRFLSRCTLGIVRVDYTEAERFVVLLARPLVLLRFRAPEYEMDADRGVVRWRIEKGLLVSRAGRSGDGYLQIDVQRCAAGADGRGRVHVEVEVANFYPAIASSIGQWVYKETQSRLHVIVTHGFLRSLARLDLAESRVGRFAGDGGTGGSEGVADQVRGLPDPAPSGRPAREGAADQANAPASSGGG